MNQIGRNLYSNFNPSELKPISERKVRALIMGSCGSGKTRFINNLCHTNHLVKSAKGSVTRDIVYEDCFYVEKGAFRIYDTPGTDSSKQALQHALVLRASLTNLPLNLIIINVKFDCRFQRTLQQISGLLKILSMYKSMVVILISHLDFLFKDPQKLSIINELFADLSQINPQIKAIFYSNTDSDFETLSLCLFKIGKCIQPKLLTIEDKIFYKHFNLSCPETKILNKEIANYLDEVQQNAKIIIDFVAPLNRTTNSDLEQLLTNLKAYTKYNLKLIQYKQYQKYSISFQNQFITTDVFLMISQFIQSKLEQLDDLCELKTNNKKVYYDSYYKKNVDVRQLFKQCPHCGLIWMRVQGCAEDTTCGYKSYYYDYEKVKDLQKYQFQIVDEKLVYQKKSQKKISEIIEEMKISQNQFFNFDQNTKQTKIGCNGLMKWGQLPLIPGIDQRLKEMYGVSNVQQLQLELNGLKVKHKSFKQELDQKVKMSTIKLKEDKMTLSYNQQEKVEQKEIQKEDKNEKKIQ